LRAPVAEVAAAFAAAWTDNEDRPLRRFILRGKLAMSGRERDVPPELPARHADVACELQHGVLDVLPAGSFDPVVREKPLEIPGAPEVIAKPLPGLHQAANEVR